LAEIGSGQGLIDADVVEAISAIYGAQVKALGVDEARLHPCRTISALLSRNGASHLSAVMPNDLWLVVPSRVAR
jgi:hypothetical protein